jgi:predicted PurR-regulated permease PerM
VTDQPSTGRWNALSLGTLVALAVVAWFIWLVRDVLLILVLAVFFAYVLDPLVARLSRIPVGRGRRLGRKPAAAIAVVIATYAIVQAIVSFVPVLWSELRRLGGELPTYYTYVESWLRRQSDMSGMGLPGEVWDRITLEWHALLEKGARWLSSALPGVVGLFGGLLGLLVVPIGAFYILSDGGTLTSGFVEGLPATWRPMTRKLLAEADRSLETYVRGQALVVIVASILYAALFTVLGLRYSLALGLMAGLAEAVPFLGSISVVAALALVTSDRGATHVFLSVGAYIVFNQILNYVITPRLMGQQLSLHPLVVILAVLAGSSLGGMLGAVLALPTAALVVALGGVLWGAGEAEADKAERAKARRAEAARARAEAESDAR